MSVKITLDASAVSSLVADDPDFHMELKRCVVAEMTRRVMPKDARDLADLVADVAKTERAAMIEAIRRDEAVMVQTQAAMDRAFEKARAEIRATSHKARTIQDVQDRIALIVEDRIGTAIRAGLAEVATSFHAKMEEMVEARVEKALSAIDVSLKTEIARQARAEAMDSLRAAIGA